MSNDIGLFNIDNNIPIDEVKFVARDGCPLSDKKAEIYGREMLRIMREVENKGLTFKVDYWMEAAKDPNSPLHSIDSWDKDVVFEKFWKQKFYQIANMVCVVIIPKEAPESPVKIPIFVKKEPGIRGSQDIKVNGSLGYTSLDKGYSDSNWRLKAIYEGGERLLNKIGRLLIFDEIAGDLKEMIPIVKRIMFKGEK